MNKLLSSGFFEDDFEGEIGAPPSVQLVSCMAKGFTPNDRYKEQHSQEKNSELSISSVSMNFETNQSVFGLEESVFAKNNKPTPNKSAKLNRYLSFNNRGEEKENMSRNGVRQSEANSSLFYKTQGSISKEATHFEKRKGSQPVKPQSPALQTYSQIRKASKER